MLDFTTDNEFKTVAKINGVTVRSPAMEPVEEPTGKTAIIQGLLAKHNVDAITVSPGVTLEDGQYPVNVTGVNPDYAHQPITLSDTNMLNVTTENYIFSSQTGSKIALGFTHDELYNYLVAMPAGSSGWIEMKSGYNLHIKAYEKGEPRITDARISDGDRQSFELQFGQEAADLLLKDH